MAVLHHPDGMVRVDDHGVRRTITVEPRPGVFVPITTCETSYPVVLVEKVLAVKGPAGVCDEILRDENSAYVRHALEWDLLSYLDEDAFEGRRLLDFGSGSGASSAVLARMFHGTQIVGVERDAAFVDLARHRAAFYAIEGRVSFLVSPDPESLPDGIGTFDHIVLSAVWEHLLPAERKVLLPMLWSYLCPGGVLFINQTPFRWFPVEAHTTGLPLLNYLPDKLALGMSRRFSKRVRPEDTWPDLLRAGIRGGTVKEIAGILRDHGGRAEILEPRYRGVRDRIDLWYHQSNATRRTYSKKVATWGFRALRATTGATIVPTLSLAFRKEA